MDIYYSRTFPVKVFPNNQMILKYKLDIFQKALDTLFRLVDLRRNQRYFQRPMNILVSKTTSKLFLGINFDKAICGWSILSFIPKKLEENPQDTMQQLAQEELGFTINCFIAINFNNFDNIINKLINIFDQYQQENEKKLFLVTYEVTPDLKKCINDVLEAISNYSFYGGTRMWIDPIFKAKNLTIDPNLCFCVLPFTKLRLEIFDEIIKPALRKDFKLNVIRSGDIFEPNQNIMESIWTYINKASFIIADISDKNPNVFYELGICHTLGKPVITLCDEESFKKDYNSKLPFDINSLNTIFYKNSGVGPTRMVKEVEKNVKAIKSGKPYIE